jgi:type VI secretion system protein ImpK
MNRRCATLPRRRSIDARRVALPDLAIEVWASEVAATNMNDNPFAEPGDDDRTIIRPMPGGLATGAWPSEAPPNERSAPVSRLGFEDMPSIGQSPILSSAQPLLVLLARLRNVLSVPDPGSLRAHTVQELRRFEEALRQRGIPMEHIRASHYALCASLDDVVRNTPWGGEGPWAAISLVAAFHGEVRSGERFFDVLRQLSQNHGKFLAVIELMYVCMSLGMQGRYRLASNGPAELERLCEETYVLIMRHRRPAERALSPHWEGVSAPHRPLRASVPVWIAAIGGAGLVGLLYTVLTFPLNDGSDRVFDNAVTLPPGHMPAITRSAPPRPLPPTPQVQTARSTLGAALAPEVARGQISIAGTEAVPIIRIQSSGLFQSGSAEIEPQVLPLLRRIGTALRDQRGAVQVVGYTDNEPIHTIAFPSNFQLSEARANAAATVIGSQIDPSRISVEGRADADAIASNDTPQGRQQNRRIEIVLHKAGTL